MKSLWLAGCLFLVLANASLAAEVPYDREQYGKFIDKLLMVKGGESLSHVLKKGGIDSREITQACIFFLQKMAVDKGESLKIEMPDKIDTSRLFYLDPILKHVKYIESIHLIMSIEKVKEVTPYLTEKQKESALLHNYYLKAQSAPDH